MEKPIHTMVLDAGPIIKNSPAVSTLVNQSERLVTVPAIISEIRDAATRSRVETTLRPFLTLRTPRPESIKLVKDFAAKTGDLAILSGPDLQVLALTRELECERNGGDWRLRNTPGQKRTNGPPPSKPIEAAADTPLGDSILGADTEAQDSSRPEAARSTQLTTSKDKDDGISPSVPEGDFVQIAPKSQPEVAGKSVDHAESRSSVVEINIPMATTHISADPIRDEPQESQRLGDLGQLSNTLEGSTSEGSDSEGWITPSNIKKHQTKDDNTSSTEILEQKTMQVACLTTDFAMQNVLLQMNLNLLSPSLQRVRHLKTFVLRCHACFDTTKDMSKQFCPRCGKPTLTRVACSTNQNGEFKLHLKKNMQWNTRGDRYSIPKPVSGSANGRVNVGGGGKGGGKGGWGQNLILAEDQKEYVRALGDEKRLKQKDLMDEDYLPAILTGERGRAGGRPKVGAGRTVNSKRR